MKNCLLIPGNPAVADHYLSWIQEIERSNSDLCVTYATSYTLFDKKLDYMRYDAAMRKHYEDLFLDMSGAGPVTIIAHSVGSYFALRLLTKYPGKIEKVFIMFPYIGYSKIFLLRFVGIPYLLDRLLPLSELLAACKNFFHKWDRHVLDITTTGLIANLRFGVRQCVYFNKQKLDITNASFNKDKISLVYRDNDRWCPSEAIESLKPISKHKRVDLPHDFIRVSENRAKMINALGLDGSKF